MTQPKRDIHLAVAALIRRDNDVLLVRQQTPDDAESHWALPGGLVEEGELIVEALGREVREETGLDIVDPGRLLYVMHFDNPNPQQVREHLGPGRGYQAVAHVFEVESWEGRVSARDPDGFVAEAGFMPLSDAIAELEKLPRMMGEPIAAYLRGEVGAGAAWLYRRLPDDQDVLVARLSGR